MRKILFQTIQNMSLSTATVKASSLKKAKHSFDPGSPYDVVFDSCQDYCDYKVHLEKSYDYIERHIDELIENPETDLVSLVKELVQLNNQIESYIQWYFPRESFDFWLANVRFERTNPELVSDAKVRELLLGFIGIKIRFLERVLNCVMKRIEYLIQWRLYHTDQLITSREADSMSKKQKFLFPVPEQPVLVWSRTDTDFLEVFTSLLRTGAFKFADGTRPTQRELIEIFEKLFNMKIPNPNSTLHNARNRKKDPTPYLTELQEAFIDTNADE
jgi:hypothetical protein